MDKEKEERGLSRRDFLRKGLGLLSILIGGEGLYLTHQWTKAIENLESDWEESLSYASVESFVEHHKQWLSRIEFGFNVSPEHLSWVYREDAPPKITNAVSTAAKTFGLTKGRFTIRMNNSINDHDFSVNLDYYQPWLEAFADNGIKLMINAGIKAARWPEIHVSDSLLQKLYPKKIPGKGYVIDSMSPLGKFALLSYYPKLYELLPKDLVYAIQPENEPLSAFGERRWRLSKGYVLNAIGLTHEYFPDALIMQNSPVAYGTFRDINSVLIKAREIHPTLRGRLLSGVNNYYKQPHLGMFSTHIGDDVLYENLAAAEAGQQFFGNISDQKAALASNGIQTMVSELQTEPWPPYYSPGNSFTEFVFTLLRSRRLLAPFNPDRKSEVFIWGIEELLHKFENTEHPYRNEHKQIISLLTSVNSLH